MMHHKSKKFTEKIATNKSVLFNMLRKTRKYNTLNYNIYSTALIQYLKSKTNFYLILHFYVAKKQIKKIKSNLLKESIWTSFIIIIICLKDGLAWMVNIVY